MNIRLTTADQVNISSVQHYLGKLEPVPITLGSAAVVRMALRELVSKLGLEPVMEDDSRLEQRGRGSVMSQDEAKQLLRPVYIDWVSRTKPVNDPKRDGKIALDFYCYVTKERRDLLQFECKVDPYQQLKSWCFAWDREEGYPYSRLGPEWPTR